MIAWSLPARVPGTYLGVWLATGFSDRVLGIAVGLMVLGAVWLSFHTVEVSQTPVTLVGAGFAAGVAGTAVAVGGPPMAIVLAHRPPREVRGTLSFFFVIGSIMSAAWFAAVGELPRESVVLGLAYLPLVGVALLLGAWAHRRIPRESFRRAVLAPLCDVVDPADRQVGPGLSQYPDAVSDDDLLAETERDATPPDESHADAVAEPRPSRVPLVLATLSAVLVLGAALVAPLVDRAIRGDEEAQRALDLTLVETWDIPGRSHTTRRRRLPADPARRRARTLRSGWRAASTTSPSATRTPCTTWSTAPCGSPTTRRCPQPTSRRLPPSSPTTGSCRRARTCPHRSWSRSGAAGCSWTVPTTTDWALFLEEYGDGHTAPELGASCARRHVRPAGRAAGGGHHRLTRRRPR